MIRERKTFKIIPKVYDIFNIIYHRETFGWKTIGFNSTLVNMERSINSKNLLFLKTYEDKYNLRVERYKGYKEATIVYLNKLLLTLYIVLILPGIIYFGYKILMRYKTKKEIKALNQIVKDARFISR